ncbi:MAG: hypothetical protein ACYTFO_11640 [Planctomycetota bacterium]|jgi:hypothetical protein
MGGSEHIIESDHNPQSRLLRLAPTIVLVAGAVVAALFGVRTLRSEDLGNHLLYGEQFWQSGRIVDHNGFLYTVPPSETPADQRLQPGPGGWYDDQGRYRFPNANWLSQVLLAGIYALGGWLGLNIALMVLIWLLLALLMVLMRRLGAGPFATAAGLIVICLSAYDRFVLRPELLGYLILLGQAIILAPLTRPSERKRIALPGLVALVALQLLLVNVHSYFLIGWGLTAAVAAASTGRLVWRRLRRRGDNGVLSATVRYLLLALLLQAAVCLVNPWTWRLAALPFQTAAYLKAHGIALGPGAHPWSWLIETRRTFLRFGEIGGVWNSVLSDGFDGEPTRAMIVIVLLGAAAAAVGLFRRGHWAQLSHVVGNGPEDRSADARRFTERRADLRVGDITGGVCGPGSLRHDQPRLSRSLPLQLRHGPILRDLRKRPGRMAQSQRGPRTNLGRLHQLGQPLFPSGPTSPALSGVDQHLGLPSGGAGRGVRLLGRALTRSGQTEGRLQHRPVDRLDP